MDKNDWNHFFKLISILQVDINEKIYNQWSIKILAYDRYQFCKGYICFLRILKHLIPIWFFLFFILWFFKVRYRIWMFDIWRWFGYWLNFFMLNSSWWKLVAWLSEIGFTLEHYLDVLFVYIFLLVLLDIHSW